MTSKERANLKSQAVNIEPVLQIGKSGITPELTEAVSETFNTRELTKIHILQSCTEDGRMLGQTLADRTGSEVVQVIGRMIVLYKKKSKELHQQNKTVKDDLRSENVVHRNESAKAETAHRNAEKDVQKYKQQKDRADDPRRKYSINTAKASGKTADRRLSSKKNRTGEKMQRERKGKL